MPFLILPKSRELSESELSRLAARLCPYSTPPRRLGELGAHAVWGTPLVEVGPSGFRNSIGGTASFSLSHSEGALAVATDPMGTCPIWYAKSEQGWIVSPEAKTFGMLMPLELRANIELIRAEARPAGWSPFENVRRLPQGCELILTESEPEPVIAGLPVSFDLVAEERSETDDWAQALGDALANSFVPIAGSNGSFVSGGIDSSIACALARRHGAVSTFSLGTEYGDEFSPAAELAEGLGCHHEEIHLGLERARDELDRVVFQNEVFDGLTAEILVQLSVLYEASAGSCTTITTGYGSDLLFDGMLRHAAYMAAIGLSSTTELIERTRWTGEFAPFVHWSHGVGADHVFWKPSVVEQALRVPRHLCWVEGVEKHVLRRGAVVTGLLPEALAFREKKGLTEGTGAHRLLADVLGLDDPYAYGEKSLRCIERLRHVL